MKIIEPSFEMLNPRNQDEGILCLRFIESMARISHHMEHKQTDDSWQRFIQSVVMDHGDFSVIEHAFASVIFRVDRGISHELVRHRLFSFTQESTRFVNGSKSYPGGLEFIRPRRLNDDISPGYRSWKNACESAEHAYLDMLDMGIRPQEARSVLPNSFATTVGVTGNLRTWRWFFLARTSIETHPDFKRLTIPLLQEFKNRIPILFDDIEPNLKQSISMAKIH